MACEHCGLTADDLAWYATIDGIPDPICCLTANLPDPERTPTHA